MSDARTVIANIKQRVYALHGGTVEAKLGSALAADILAALADAGFELIDTKVTRPDWKSIARDMTGIHDLERRRAYFRAAETLEPGYTKETANEQ